jgi:hypothetical protein
VILSPLKVQPHYHILFSTSYGLDRKQLDFLNRLARSSPHNQPFNHDSKSKKEVYHHPSYTFTLASSLSPSILFDPITCELTGAGFQKTNDSRYYELRWPRMTKFNQQDRSVNDALSLEELQSVARKAMIRAGEHEEGVEQINDWIWNGGKDSQQAGKNSSVERREEEIQSWITKLETADKVNTESHQSTLAIIDNSSIFQRLPKSLTATTSLPIISSNPIIDLTADSSDDETPSLPLSSTSAPHGKLPAPAPALAPSPIALSALLSSPSSPTKRANRIKLRQSTSSFDVRARAKFDYHLLMVSPEFKLSTITPRKERDGEKTVSSAIVEAGKRFFEFSTDPTSASSPLSAATTISSSSPFASALNEKEKEFHKRKAQEVVSRPFLIEKKRRMEA